MTIVRPIEANDRAQWQPLWDGYNLFYERPEFSPEITNVAWSRFFDPNEPMFAAVAEREGRLVGLVHYLFHRSTTMVEDVCYLQDLFTAPEARGEGVGKALIEYVYEQARAAGSTRVYWQTHENNPARKLYDQVAQLTAFRRYVKDL
jgi:GNAT superfamily N-acetyltransferase